MASHYFIDQDGVKDGPHDLVTIMRRIRAGKIGPDTGIFIDADEAAIPASTLPDTAMFFSREEPAAEPKAKARPKHAFMPSLRLNTLVREGWRFTAEHSIMTVFAGGILLLSTLMASILVRIMPAVVGSMLAWVLFLTFHYLFFACCMRLYRGQRFSRKFLDEQLFPMLGRLFLAGLLLGLMMVGGFMALVLPGLIVAIFYAFVPFFILDRQMNLIEAMTASRLLSRKHRGAYQATIAFLTIIYVGCLILIVPIPVALPAYSAALCKLYEELSSS
ncbi:MAG: DUF4339 domain-containing protein [Proteobacteria bacterium]|nr:DUF4339 domain-containing protein [Pseudomonadota bacterium]